MVVKKDKVLFKQVYPCFSDRAYINIIVNNSVVQDGLVMDTDFSKFMDCTIKEIDPDVQKIDKFLTVGVMNVVIS